MNIYLIVGAMLWAVIILKFEYKHSSFLSLALDVLLWPYSIWRVLTKH